MATPRAHIEEIRKTKFSIGADIANPLTEDLHQAVKNLSAELYAKDVHFLMELIQNAEDNEYPEDVKPSLEFVFTSRDITATGAPTTLLIFNNEKGFSRKNIESISSVGRSTKKGLRKHGYIGEKEENSEESSANCSYYMWKQKFPVLSENIVERRAGVEYCHITLAFPTGERLQKGVNSPGPGVYAYLPTEMVTNFPFIIQADFVLASSRETILMDDKWNQGILNCVPFAFVNAFTSLVKDSVDAPASCLPPIFRFLPLKSTSYPLLNTVRDSIRKTLMEEDIIPSEQCTDQKFFHKPRDVGRLMPAFWSILRKARQQGVSLHNQILLW